MAISVVRHHPPRSGASGPRLPPAAIEKLLHRNMDGACWIGTKPWGPSRRKHRAQRPE